jgi:cytoskeletal protein RodZ
MRKNDNRSTVFALILVIIFLLIIIFGKYFVGSPQTPSDQASVKPTTSSTSYLIQNKNQASSSVPAATSDAPISQASCEENLRSEIVSKKESYAKGQILVTFKKDQTYQNTKAVLAAYGLVIQNENNSQASFAARHLVTAAVSTDQEIHSVCTLRSDARVVYAGLDLYFTLHE